MKKTIQLLVFIFSMLGMKIGWGQCSVTGVANPDTVLCGDSVYLSAFGIGGTPLIDVDFNSGSAGTGWASTLGVDFTNPCNPGPDGTYMWMGDGTPAPRSLTTVTLDLSCGATICFDFRMAVQGDNTPCEGPDLPNEGVFLQYSDNNGTSWNNVYYFNPDTNGTGGGTASPFTTWDNYCFQLPSLSATSLIRWAQTATSGNIYDHWGLDNVQIYSNCSDPYVYQWNGMGQAQDTFVYPIAQTDTSFVVSYYNSSDTCFDTVDVHILPRPLYVSQDIELCDTVAGVDAQLIASGANSFTWSIVPGGDPISGGNFGCATCDTTWAHPSFTTSYAVSSDLTGICHGTDTVTVAIVSAFNPDFTFPSTVCLNGGIQSLLPVNSGGLWTGGGIGDANLGEFDPLLSGAGTIPVTYTIPGACANVITHDIEVLPLPDASITAPNQYCYDGGAIPLIGATAGGVFSGTGGVDGVNSTFDPAALTPGVYTVYYTLSTPCYNADTHLIEVVTGIPYQVNSPVVLCDVDTVNLQDSIDLSTLFQEPTTISFTGPGVINTSTGELVGNGLLPGIHKVLVTVTDTFGLCASTDSLDISINLTEFNSLIKDSYCSEEGNVFLQTDKPLATTLWDNYPIAAGGGTIRLNSFNGFNVADYEEGEWVFRFSYTNINGCTGNSTDTLVILNSPISPSVLPETYCENEAVILDVVAGNADSIIWAVIEGPDTVFQDVGGPFSLIDPAKQGVKVVLKEVNGICQSDVTAYEIPVSPAPEAEFRVSYTDLNGISYLDTLILESDTIRSYMPVTLWLSAQNYWVSDSLFWNLNYQDWSGNGDIIINDDGDVPSLPQDFRSPGLHQLWLNHVNEFGCEDQYSIYLEVIGTEQLPNVFTPNGDGINDLFYIQAPVRDFTVQIFNRWGTEIYSYNCNQCSQKEKGWDGGNAGDGTYFYTVTGKYNDGSAYQQKGSITITGSN